MTTPPTGTRNVKAAEVIEETDCLCNAEGELSNVPSWMVGKTMYDAGIQYFTNNAVKLVVVRFENQIQFTEKENALKVLVTYTNKIS